MGAIVAPAIFRTIPAPYSGDGMAVAFARFDRVAIGLLAVALLAEAGRGLFERRIGRWDRVRLSCVGVALLATVFVAMKVTPAIAALHVAGAMRGVGELGERLEAIHALASRVGKGTLACELGAMILLLRVRGG